MGDPSKCRDPKDAARPTAAVLLIGNELLTGKIRDENGHFAAGFLRRRGIALATIETVADDIDAIADSLRRLANGHPQVITSGGVGPTHDDVTFDGLARAFGRRRRHSAAMERALRASYREQLSPSALRMAQLPEGTTLLGERGWPLLRLDVGNESSARIYVLPGVPAVFRAKLEELGEMADELPQLPGWVLEVVETQLDETVVAPHLEAVLADFPGVEIGSYPRWRADEDGQLRMSVRVTIEAGQAQAELVRHARDKLAERLGRL